ncbi:MAG: NAD(P)-dependent oxidoreductase [Spirochaetales bacterium]|uniref:NAD(P)-dependent oxidoreductase n=1 Tax=Candidatus Thalassospirochaeta sargassi TaxID=3119039 RepID=A0AAJ1IER8_9SPIO|nr:NAD(P)-dependent oxidoreductase [Spirochaetales bacterium]
MKILIADKLSKTAVEALKAAGMKKVEMDPDLTTETLPSAVAPYDILVVRSTKVTEEVIRAGVNLSLIVRAGAGVNTIDLKTASLLGIHVANCPGKNTAAVAELVMGLMIAADRRIADCTADLRAGVWNKKLYSKAAGIKGRTLGIIGMGAIGRAVAKRAKGFEMNVAAWSRSLTPERAEELGIVYCENPLDAARQSDVVTVHLAASADTKHFIDTAFFSEMKENSIFINTSRGEIVDTAALKKAAETKGLKIALDVYENEPPATSNEFTDTGLAAAVTGTHHIGASTSQAAESVAAETVRVITEYRSTGTPPNVVNLRDKNDTDINLVVRHFNHVGILAGVLDEIRTAGINIEEMQNSIFKGDKAAVCTIKLDNMPGDELLQKIAAVDDIINVSLK